MRSWVIRNSTQAAKLRSRNAAKNILENSSLKSAKIALSTTKVKAKSRIAKSLHSLVPLGFACVFGFIIIVGSKPTDVTNDLTYRRVSGADSVVAVDDVSAALIATKIAQNANLIIADNVKNKAESLEAQIDFSPAESSYLSKPQVVSTDVKTNKDIITYKVKEGETVETIAKKWNVTTETIRWENNLIGNYVAPGTILRILPVSGIKYTVRAGDTPEKLADQFNANAAQIIAFNDAELSGLKPGQTIIIPNGERRIEQPSYLAYYNFQALFGGNGYSYGYCTWHVANRRQAIGNPLPRNLGNAVTWYALAERAGLPTGTVPRVGAVVWPKNAASLAGGLGHVAFIERANPDGSFWVSDMNYFGYTAMDVNSPETGGWNRLSYRLLTPEEFAENLYIY